MLAQGLHLQKVVIVPLGTWGDEDRAEASRHTSYVTHIVQSVACKVRNFWGCCGGRRMEQTGNLPLGPLRLPCQLLRQPRTLLAWGSDSGATRPQPS